MKHTPVNYFILSLKLLALLIFIFVTSAINIYLEKEKKRKYNEEVKKLNAGDASGDDGDDADGDAGGDDGDGDAGGDYAAGIEGFKPNNGKCVIKLSYVLMVLYYILYVPYFLFSFFFKAFFSFIFSRFFPPNFKSKLKPIIKIWKILYSKPFEFLYYTIFRVLSMIDMFSVGLLFVLNTFKITLFFQNIFGAILSPFLFLRLGFITKYISKYTSFICWSEEGLAKDYVRYVDYLKNFFS